MSDGVNTLSCEYEGFVSAVVPTVLQLRCNVRVCSNETSTGGEWVYMGGTGSA